MDIAKYIGLYLLKNQYCYIHGLGNLELVKRPGVNDGKTLNAATYDVILTHGGSIDDGFANFIATNEMISISKAANALRDFSMQTRKDLADGKEVVVTNIGKYVQSQDKIRFITDERFSFKPAGIPIVQNSKHLEEQKAKALPNIPLHPTPQKADSVNWTMVILVVVLLIILGGGGFGFYYYKSHQKTNNTTPVPLPQPIKDTTPPVKQQPVIDTVPHVPDSNQVAMPAHDSIPPPAHPTQSSATDLVYSYKAVIGYYNNREKAEKRMRQLLINGNHVSVMAIDSTTYLVLSELNCKASDTSHAKDSLGALFGYKRVRIITK